MAFIDTPLVVGEVTYYPFPGIPAEAPGSDARQPGAQVTFQDLAGNAIDVLRADTRTAVSSLTASETNGVVPSLYAAHGTIAYVTNAGVWFVTSPAYANLQEVAIAAGESAQAAASSAETASISAANSAASAQAAATAAQNASTGTSGTPSGYFRIQYVNGAWEHLTLQSALDAGMKETDTAVFRAPLDVTPTPEPPAWAREGLDEWDRA